MPYAFLRLVNPQAKHLIHYKARFPKPEKVPQILRRGQRQQAGLGHLPRPRRPGPHCNQGLRNFELVPLEGSGLEKAK